VHLTPTHKYHTPLRMAMLGAHHLLTSHPNSLECLRMTPHTWGMLGEFETFETIETFERFET
jgi:hypothetical protein